MNGWSIDYSTGRPILTKDACSVIQDEDAHAALEAIRMAHGIEPGGRKAMRIIELCQEVQP